MIAAWKEIGEAEKSLSANLNNDIHRKALNKAARNLAKDRKAAVLGSFGAYVLEIEARVCEGDQAGSYEHLKTIYLQGKPDRSSKLIKYVDCNLLHHIESALMPLQGARQRTP